MTRSTGTPLMRPSHTSGMPSGSAITALLMISRSFGSRATSITPWVQVQAM